MLSVFTVSLGFGIVLPSLPFLIEQLLGTSGDAVQVSRATGLSTGLFMLALFLFSPLWGRLSDRIGCRIVLLTGLLGFSATSLAFAFVESLPAVYAARFANGLFAAAVTPIALATIGYLATTETTRARQLTFVSLAGITGFLVGPMLGTFVASSTSVLIPGMAGLGPLVVPLAGTAALALIVASGVLVTLNDDIARDSDTRQMEPAEPRARWLIARLLALAFIVSAGVGVFEVGLALRGRQDLGLTPFQIATMFTECSLVMVAVQAVIFSPWIKPETTRWFILPAFALLAAGLFLVPYASDFKLMLVATGGVAASAGILSPILTYWISSKAGRAQGAELGKQTAAASLGAAVGSVAGGVLFDVAWLPNASFVLVAGLTVGAVILSLGLPEKLTPRKHGAGPGDRPRAIPPSNPVSLRLR